MSSKNLWRFSEEFKKDNDSELKKLLEQHINKMFEEAQLIGWFIDFLLRSLKHGDINIFSKVSNLIQFLSKQISNLRKEKGVLELKKMVGLFNNSQIDDINERIKKLGDDINRYQKFLDFLHNEFENIKEIEQKTIKSLLQYLKNIRDKKMGELLKLQGVTNLKKDEGRE
jgi:hypothetical protein